VDTNTIALLALQIALGVIQLATYLLTKRTIQTSMRPPAQRDPDDRETPRERRREP